MAEWNGAAPGQPDGTGPVQAPFEPASALGDAPETALRLDFDADSQPGRTIVMVSGEVDMLTAPLLRDKVSPSVTAPAGDVALHLNGVTFLGSNGLGALVELSQRAKDAGTALRLVCSTNIVTRPLALTGLDQVLDLYDSIEDLPPTAG